MLGTEGPWIPYKPTPHPRNRKSTRAMVIFLNFSYRLTVIGDREAGSNYLKPAFNCT